MSVRDSHPTVTRRTRRGATVLFALLLGCLSPLAVVATAPSAAGAVATASSAADPCGTGGNKIACENSKPGTPASVWDDQYGAGSDAIQGFSTQISTNVGGKVDFKIDTAATNYTITIFRIGYYGGDGARQITTVAPSIALPQRQPACITDVTTELYDCGNWAVSASWNVPSTAVSGVYIARLLIPSTNESSQITFVVRDDASTSDVVFQTSDPTWVAYNLYGGSNFYSGGANGRAYKLSYNRPMLTRGGTGGRDFFFANEYPLVRFLERNGYDVSYISGVDTDRNPALLRRHKTFLSVGHDEYWSGAQRASMEAARDAGVNMQFLSGNEGYWRTRYEPSADTSRTAYRTLVSYKETWDRRKIDPSPEWTGTWRDPRYAPQSQGAGRPENALTGTLYHVNHDDLAVKVSDVEGKYRLWRGTSLASLPTGGSASLAPHTVGYESNEDRDNGFRPSGLVRLSTTTGPTPELLTDFGNTVVPGTTTHHLTMYKAPSGALVFSAGSVQWTWGLDAEHDSSFTPEPADARMQQAEVNLLADMGAQPTTLMAGLVPATKSTDTTGPSVAITAPAAGAGLANGSNVTVSGTATDAGGGRVAGVEVSLDSGDTWHPATGTTSWSWTGVQHGLGGTSIRVRATDDSANIGAIATRAVVVSCPCSVLGSATPPVDAADDTSANELGLRFSPDVDGFVSGVRFYKGAGNGGAHTGSLWSSTGTRLAQVTFQNESASGWQTARFVSPVAVTAGQQYVVSYTAPQGRYSVQENGFASLPTRSVPLTVAGGYGAAPAGLFAGPGAFPTETSGNANYYVDALFTTTDGSPLIVTSQTPAAGSSSVAAGTTVKATFSKPVTATSVVIALKDGSGAAVPGTTSYDATTRTATFAPAAMLAGDVLHTATVTAKDATGQSISNGSTWTFRVAKPQGAAGVCPCSLFGDDTVPTTPEVDDSSAVTLGVRFSVDAPGTVTAVRFYKGACNTGIHSGTLWSADGTQQLASGTFSNESTSGWQTLSLTTPVSLEAGREYVASYRASVGHYSTGAAFSGGDRSRGPIKVGSTAGAYTYGTGFPANASGSNYLVDVVFQRSDPALEIVAQDPPPGALQVSRTSSVRVGFSTAIQSSAALVAKVGGTAIAGTKTLDTDGTRLSFAPSSPLPADTLVTVELTNVRSTAGATLADRSWSFRTEAAGTAAAQTLFGDVVPATSSTDDSSPVEVGTAFTPTRDGAVRALRFFKGAGNGGTHVGSLWNASGTRIAQVTFAGESTSGWQRAVLATPVRVVAGQTYVVSYLAPQGHYSSTAAYFANQVTAGQLTMPAGNNGRYLYGAAGGLPTNSFNATSYFADVEYVPDAPTIGVTGKTPADGATGVSTDARPSASFSAAVTTSGTLTASAGATAIAGTSLLSSDGRKLTFVPAAALPGGAAVTMKTSGVVSADGAVLADQTWSFTTAAAPTGTTTALFADTTTLMNFANDADAVELGTQFSSSVNGVVTAVRFYKGPSDTGIHTGSIWSSAGQRLATGTFEAETSSGVQTLVLDQPVPITAGQTYVASYYAPRGGYAATAGNLSTPYTQGPLTVPANGGRYRYGAGGGFPTSTYNGSNYWVGVVFRS